MSRDLIAEGGILNHLSEGRPEDLELRKRRDFCLRACRDRKLRPLYLSTYPKEPVNGYRPATAPENPKPPQGGLSTAPPKKSNRHNLTDEARSKANAARVPPPKHKKPTNEEFVRAWMTSESTVEVAEKLNIPGHGGWCGTKAGGLRKAGVDLPKLPPQSRRKKVDVAGLNDLAQSLRERS